jgi:hypothetical protein
MNLIDKLEVGNKYKTEDGKELTFIYAITPTNSVNHPLIFLDEYGSPQCYTSQGTYSNVGESKFDVDLSQFKEEPKYYSETLKKLIEQKVNLKFRIKDEQQSKELQEFLFSLGVFWRDDCEKLIYLNHPFLWASGKGCEFAITSEPDDEAWFRGSSAQEFDLEKDCLVEKPKEKIDLRKVLKIGGIYWTENKLNVCLIGIDKNDDEIPYLFYIPETGSAYWYSEDGSCFNNKDASLDLTQFEEKK